MGDDAAAHQQAGLHVTLLMIWKLKSHQTISLLIYFRNQTNSILLLFHPNQLKLLSSPKAKQTNSFNPNKPVSNCILVKFSPNNLVAPLST